MLYGYKFTITKCTSCKMEHRHTLRFLLVRGFTTVLLVGGLGVEDQENGLHHFPLLLYVIPIRWDRAKKEIHRSKPRTLDEQEQSIRDSFFAVPLDSLRKSVELVSSRLQKRTNPCWNLTLNGNVLALKWCKKCSYMASILEDTVILLWRTCFRICVF